MSRHHHDPNGLWSPTLSAAWRKRLTPLLPLPCIDCGQRVEPEHPWDVGHLVPLSQGGTATADNIGPSHRSCNRRAGGRMGAAITNEQRLAYRANTERFFKL